MPNIIQLSILSYDDFLDPMERESLGKSEVMSESDNNSSTGAKINNLGQNLMPNMQGHWAGICVPMSYSRVKVVGNRKY